MGGGGYDIGLSASMASSASSGLQGNIRDLFGDTIVGGKKTPVWIPLAVTGAIVVVASLFILRFR